MTAMEAATVSTDPLQRATGEQAEAIHIEKLHKRFGALEVLKGVSLTARDGDVVAMIGGSGSGKSTFLRCINFLENPTSGIIRINGEDVKMVSDGHGLSLIHI